MCVNVKPDNENYEYGHANSKSQSNLFPEETAFNKIPGAHLMMKYYILNALAKIKLYCQ
jgi:hypothetical protein